MRYDELSPAEQFHLLVNLEDHPGFLETAKAIAERYFAAADYSASPLYAPFAYSPEAFDRRLDEIYAAALAASERRSWLDTGKVQGREVGRFSREAVVEFLRQMAPINLTDGAWLRNIMGTGPCDRVRAALFAIWIDEAGNGKAELNHANIYDDLLRGQQVYLPPMTSPELLEVGLLPSAFESPVFQVSAGAFPQAFLPELLGMTLYLEWESTPTLLPMMRLLEGRDIDPHFYRLHVAIDNIASGHGAIAKQTVKAHLDDVRERGGDRAVDEHFLRIWKGYVAWATVGNFGSDLVDHLLRFDKKTPAESQRADAAQKMAELIRKKAPIAGLSHGMSHLGGARLNDLFAEPEKLLQILAGGRWINREQPRESLFLTELLGPRGAMYKVFDESEIETILDWIESLKPD